MRRGRKSRSLLQEAARVSEMAWYSAYLDRKRIRIMLEKQRRKIFIVSLIYAGVLTLSILILIVLT